MIRDAVLDDIPELVEMGRRFIEQAKLHVGFDRASCEILLQQLIEGEGGLLLRGENSMFGAVIYPHPFNNAHTIGQELFWYSEGREGFRLLREAEKAIKGKCNSMVMVTMETVNPDRMASLYGKMGFVPMERGFVKEF